MRLEALFGAVVIFVAIGVTLSIGADINQTIKRDAGNKTYTAANETITANNSAQKLANPIVSVSAVMNGTHILRGNLTKCGVTGGAVCNLVRSKANAGGGLANFTYNTTHINVTVSDAEVEVGFEGSSWAVTYTWTGWSPAELTSENSTIGLQNISRYLPTIGTVLAASVIIGLVTMAFLTVRRKGE